MGKIASAVGMFRPVNGIMAAVAVSAGAALSAHDPNTIDIVAVALLSLSSFLTVSFMNVFNDLRDISTDRIAHPERPLVKGTISPEEGGWMIVGLLVSALILTLVPSILMGRWEPLAIFAFVLSLDLTYEAWFKCRGIWGNVNIGILTGTLFLFGASIFSITTLVILIGAMASLVNVGRELVKDVQDREGDRGSRRTLVMAGGERFTLFISHVFITLGILLSLSLPLVTRIHPLAFMTIIVANIIFMISIPISRDSPQRSQTMLKVGMACAMVGFILQASVG
ncbi:MAG: UbiA family prenyltransferase [Thermoplasmata archaeon]|nr:UbiA family prenyltransferase [Thermoplasmata archaeon]